MGQTMPSMLQLSHLSSTTAWGALKSTQMLRCCAKMALSSVVFTEVVKLQEECMAVTDWEATPSWIALFTAGCAAEVQQGSCQQPTSSTYRRLVWQQSSD